MAGVSFASAQRACAANGDDRDAQMKRSLKGNGIRRAMVAELAAEAGV
jgi:hypothetical protein